MERPPVTFSCLRITADELRRRLIVERTSASAYARYSSDNESVASIDRQFCIYEHAARENGRSSAPIMTLPSRAA